MTTLNWSDVTLAVRLIRKQPVLTFAAICALATGIGLAAFGFTFVDAGLRARLPFAGGDRFVLFDVYEEPGARRARAATDRFNALRGATPALDHLGAFESSAQNLLLSSEEVALVAGVAITPESFAVLPYAPVHGRTLRADDAAPRAPPVVVIRESLWSRHFSADPAAVGRLVNLSGMPHEIVGVMPDALEFPNSPELWLPLADTSNARIFGVLAEDQALAAAQTQVTTVSRQFELAHPGAPTLRLEVATFVEALSRGVGVLVAGLVFVVLLVLLVIAANVANLILARALSRSAELAVRSALGASRARLVSQMFVEVLVLGVIAAVIGVTGSALTFRWIRATLTDMPFWVDLSAGPRTAIFVGVVTIVAAAVGGAWPALRATRQDAQQVLAASNRRVAGGFGWAGSAMIALQIALSIGALHASLVVARGVAGYMQGAAIAGETEIVTARLFVPDTLDAERVRARVLDTVHRLPGVRHAGFSTSLPRLSPPMRMTLLRDESSEPRAAPVVAVSPGFIDTLGGRIVAGRAFTAADLGDDAPPVVLVNEPFVFRFLGGGNPIGRQLRFVDADDSQSAPEWREIVGVVPDLGLSAGDTQFAAGIYVPLAQHTLIYLSARVAGNPAAMTLPLRRAVADADPRIQIRDVLPLPDVGSEDRAVFAGMGAALTALGATTLALSMMGVYALLSFSVTARTRELAIRSALGASRGQVVRAVLARAAVPLMVGAAIGPLVSNALVAVRGIFVFRLPSEAGALPIALLCAVLALSALAAAWLPSRRALRISIADALKADP